MATLEQIQQALDDLYARYAKTLTALDQALEQLESAQAPVVATEVPQDELMEAARLMSMSDMNKEDLSAQDIYDMMMKTSEEEVREPAPGLYRAVEAPTVRHGLPCQSEAARRWPRSTGAKLSRTEGWSPTGQSASSPGSAVRTLRKDPAA